MQYVVLIKGIIGRSPNSAVYLWAPSALRIAPLLCSSKDMHRFAAAKNAYYTTHWKFEV